MTARADDDDVMAQRSRVAIVGLKFRSRKVSRLLAFASTPIPRRARSGAKIDLEPSDFFHVDHLR